VAVRDDKRPLPRGPHGLSRAEVQRSQRDRLLQATTDAVADLGYVKVSVADILERAGVSRATFYQLFRGKAECFEAAYRETAELVAAVLVAELDDMRADQEHDPLVRLDRVLGTYLEVLQAAPALARVFLVEVYAAGPAAIEQRRESLEHFVDVVAETFRGQSGLLGAEPQQRFAAEVMVGAVSSMVTNIVGVGEPERLSSLREPLVGLAAQLAGLPAPSP
jgi:AcrR family transcriptional regulator